MKKNKKLSTPKSLYIAYDDYAELKRLAQDMNVSFSIATCCMIENALTLYSYTKKLQMNKPKEKKLVSIYMHIDLINDIYEIANTHNHSFSMTCSLLITSALKEGYNE